METKKYQFNITLDREEIEREHGVLIPLGEWIPFCETFEKVYLGQYLNTMEMLIQEGWQEFTI